MTFKRAILVGIPLLIVAAVAFLAGDGRLLTRADSPGAVAVLGFAAMSIVVLITQVLRGRTPARFSALGRRVAHRADPRI